MKVVTIMSEGPRVVSRRASLDHAMALIDAFGIRHLPVVGDEELVGVVSDRDLLAATGWLSPREREVLEAPEVTVEDVMHAPPVTVAPDDGLERVLELFLEKRVGCLPVVQGRDLVGIVTEMDVLRVYAEACRRGRVAPEDDPSVAELMTRDLVTVAPDPSGDEAERCLRERKLRHLPVVGDGRLVGIVSDRDVRRLRGRGQLEVTLVSELMSPDPLTARTDEALASVAGVLASARISALPVVEGGRAGGGLAGIVTIRDVLHACARTLRGLE